MRKQEPAQLVQHDRNRQTGKSAQRENTGRVHANSTFYQSTLVSEVLMQTHFMTVGRSELSLGQFSEHRAGHPELPKCRRLEWNVLSDLGQLLEILILKTSGVALPM